MEQSLVFIHGFLGEPKDWQPIVKKLEPLLDYETARFHFIDLNNDFSIAELNFKNWPEAFSGWREKQKIKEPICLVGYSMGGRLINPLLEKGLAQKAIFLSSQFGFPDDDILSRTERRKTDQVWAQKFLKESWDSIVQEWNEQPIFKNSNESWRDEKIFDRQKLAAFLTAFSLSEQKDYSDLWLRPDLSLLYLVGEQDSKYRLMAEQIQEKITKIKAKNKKISVLKSSGHRLLLDQPQLVAQEISYFLK